MTPDSDSATTPAITWLSTPPRHPRRRHGDREPLPSFVRTAVIRRDGGRCEMCGTRPSETEIDHVVPWSANGSDATTNLRTLCRRCNQERSNFVDEWGEQRKRLPATWWCLDCAEGESVSYLPGRICFVPLRVEIGDPVRDPHYGCVWCYEPWWYVANVEQLAEPMLGFCAHCDATCYTLWPL